MGQDVTDVPARPPATAEDLKTGERLFQIHCAYCHGPDGSGGRGANLAKAKLRRAPDDTALFKVILHGIPGSEMPSNDLTANQIWQVVGYVQSLAHIAHPKVAGDATRGKNLYEAKGNCAACHSIAGYGGAIGPDLTGIGDSKGLDYLRRALLDPNADVPDGFLQIRLIPKNGTRITGVRLNEDIFSIQIRDLAGNFHSFWKDQLRELNKDTGKSPMPSYRQTFTPHELDDVLAFLESLQGNQ